MRLRSGLVLLAVILACACGGTVGIPAPTTAPTPTTAPEVSRQAAVDAAVRSSQSVTAPVLIDVTHRTTWPTPATHGHSTPVWFVRLSGTRDLACYAATDCDRSILEEVIVDGATGVVEFTAVTIPLPSPLPPDAWVGDN